MTTTKKYTREERNQVGSALIHDGLTDEEKVGILHFVCGWMSVSEEGDTFFEAVESILESIKKSKEGGQ